MYVNVPLDNTTVANPVLGNPMVSTVELLALVRVDKSLGETLLAGKILQAMDTINRQVIFVGTPTTDQERIYKRAVCYEAAALIGEDNLDFDTAIGAGEIRGENGFRKSQSLRREVQYAIADLTGRKRNRVKLV